MKSNEKRYLPHWPLPPYAFVPGKNPHPLKPDGHMYSSGEPSTVALSEKSPQECEFLRYSLDLFNYEYFWESHVYLEALWNAHHRKGPVADFFKAIIKLSAAGVKVKLNQINAAIGHLDRALELLNDVKKLKNDLFLGFSLEKLETDIKEQINIISNQDSINTLVIKLHPRWS